MNAVRRLMNSLLDSPTFDRDRANLISGFAIGTTALLLNAAVMSMVLPLMLTPDDRDFRMLTESMEFGQLLGLILTGGVTAFATVLIPARLASVFMAPRIGRFFDQIVLSGISPFRYLIGKVVSQNLFLALVLFLLLPWFVLVLSLGGLQWTVFLANLFLVWLYCMQLALVMLCVSLYLNELLAMMAVIGGATILCGLGCAPFPVQPFVMTPFPALMHSIYRAVEMPDVAEMNDYPTVFLLCALTMSAGCGVALAVIGIGPLYGIIRDNSTFGEVVRPGDSRRKRRFRFRLHIQRPSEIAFFYENRGSAFVRHEGLIRWCAAVGGLMLVSGLLWLTMITSMARAVPVIGASQVTYRWLPMELQTMCHVFHGLTLLPAVFLFSHPRNTTFQRLPVLFGWKPTVALLDSLGFGLMLLLSTALSIGVPLLFEQWVALPAGTTVYPPLKWGGQGDPFDFWSLSIRGTLILSLSALTIYVLQRSACLWQWMKSGAFALVGFAYLGVICLLPLVSGLMMREMPGLREIPVLHDNAMAVMMISPGTCIVTLYEDMGAGFPKDPSRVPFVIVHAALIAICLLTRPIQNRRLLSEYRTFATGDPA